MIFCASSEVYRPVGKASETVRLCVEPFLNTAFSESSLATLEGKLRYVPIIMPDEARERYPARSRFRKKEKVYDCAPQLDYDVFLNGSFEEQLREYIGGIAPSAPHLAKLGASKEQIADFENIMNTAARRILAQREQASG
ncbi:MAG: hypothetical protein EA357_00100 [Micavibrio sp.]|nr:MAG: hypothetical protein EA357_00100 [Micavibrio sp.]